MPSVMKITPPAVAWTPLLPAPPQSGPPPCTPQGLRTRPPSGLECSLTRLCMAGAMPPSPHLGTSPDVVSGGLPRSPCGLGTRSPQPQELSRLIAFTTWTVSPLCTWLSSQVTASPAGTVSVSDPRPPGSSGVNVGTSEWTGPSPARRRPGSRGGWLLPGMWAWSHHGAQPLRRCWESTFAVFRCEMFPTL